MSSLLLLHLTLPCLPPSVRSPHSPLPVFVAARLAPRAELPSRLSSPARPPSPPPAPCPGLPGAAAAPRAASQGGLRGGGGEFARRDKEKARRTASLLKFPPSLYSFLRRWLWLSLRSNGCLSAFMRQRWPASSRLVHGFPPHHFSFHSSNRSLTLSLSLTLHLPSSSMPPSSQ